MGLLEDFEELKPQIDKFFAQSLRELFRNVNIGGLDRIIEIFNIAIDSALKSCKPESSRRSKFSRIESNAPVLIKGNSTDFKCAIEYFDVSIESRRRFIANFTLWEALRMGTINKLTEIAGEMNENKLKCNVTRVAGSSVGLLSGIGLLASIVFPPMAIPMGVAGVSGAVVAISGDIAEKVWRDQLQEAAKTEVSEDQKYFQGLMEHFQHTASLKSGLEKIINYQDLSQVLKNLKPFCFDLLKRVVQMKHHIIYQPSIFANELRFILQPMIQMLVNEGILLLFHQYARYIVLFAIACYIAFDLLACIVPLLVDEENALSLALSGSSLAVNIGKTVSVARATSRVAKVAGSPSGMPRLYLQLKSLFTSEKVVPKVASAVGSKAAMSLTGIGIIIDLATIYYNASDVLNGSVSEHALKIKNMTKEMEAELALLRRVYDRMSS